MSEEFCQSCAMPMCAGDFGTNADGSENHDYCKYCFADGAFTMDCTMEEMIENNLKFMAEFNQGAGTPMTADQAREQMQGFFPKLKRWSK